MSQPWHIPIQNAPFHKKKKKPPEPYLLKHYCSLNIHERPYEDIQTSLMCEITASSREPETIQRLVAAGMTIARINLRDHNPESCAQLLQSIRQAAYNYSLQLDYVYPLAVAVDLRGPDIVTGDLKDGPGTLVELVENNTVRLSSDDIWKYSCTSDCLYIGSDALSELNTGDIIYIECITPGNVKVVVSAVGEDSIECFITRGGKIGSKMAVWISRPSGEPIKAKKGICDSLETSSLLDEKPPEGFEHLEGQLSWVVASDIDAVLVPNTQNVCDINVVKDLLLDKGKNIMIFACIDTVFGYDNIDDILGVADGIYIDRSILSMDLPIEKICIAQKVITAKCNSIGVPCICKAVINELIPALCVTDIANMTLDGIDVFALELHYESPLRKLTRDAIRMAEHCLVAASVICRQAERISWQPRTYGKAEIMLGPIDNSTLALCLGAVELAMRTQAAIIICITNSGYTAKTLSRVRPPCPVIAVTKACQIARQLRFWRSIRAVHYFEATRRSWASEVEARVYTALDYCKAKCMVRAGDPYVIITGTRRGARYCDTIRLLYASARDTTPVNDIN